MLRCAKNRTQFGKPLAAFRLVQQKLARMVNEITKAQLLVPGLWRLKGRGKATPARISLARMNDVSSAQEIARTGRDLRGADGIHNNHQVGRHMRNLAAARTYEGTKDIHTLVVGEDVTGIPASA